jgi:hypothetical protein
MVYFLQAAGGKMRPTPAAMIVAAALSLTACSQGKGPSTSDRATPIAAAVADAAVTESDGPGAGASTACVPLADLTSECPATWPAALADQGAFCATKAPSPSFDAFVSTAPCRGFLRYSRHLWDAGPRYCLYDPTTLALRGYRASDGKLMFEATTCGSAKTDFGDEQCAGTTCPLNKAGCDDLQKLAHETIQDVAASVDQCATDADCVLINDRVGFDCEDCLPIYGNDNVKAAIAAQAPSINAVCENFKRAGCKIIPSGCPAPPLDGATCVQRKCVFSN